MTGFQPIGYEFAAELTFPEPEGAVSGILNISTHIFGIAVTLLISGLQQILGDFVGNMVNISEACRTSVSNSMRFKNRSTTLPFLFRFSPRSS